MKLAIRRVLLFVENLDEAAAFYEHKIGLKPIAREKGFVDFDAGAVHLALHSGTGRPSRNKLCFYVANVSSARKQLIARGVRMGCDPGSGAGLKLCDGKDPAGNIFQLSNRK